MVTEVPVESVVGNNLGADTPGGALLLASRSPRRRTLLDEGGLAHEAEHPGFDDAILEPGKVSPQQWVMSLAYLKAWAKARDAERGRIVLGADTTCVIDGRMVGTPRDADEAAQIIRSFVNREHDVITGVALVEAGTGRRRLFADTATVRFGPLLNAEIDRYVASGEWSGKAGAYNLSERLNAGWPITFRGDPSTIMGLPMKRLARELAAFRAARTAN
ncbi:dTTP/UTP pyrophosphatase [Phycisphaerales bacterium]|nr:dTTP/UTP pyrophosphatase [Phycisphaerales bacterium]